MTNRREFLQTGAVVSVLAVHGLVPREAVGAAAVRSGAAPPNTIYDERYAECRTFAAAACELGAAVRHIERGDVTAVYDELDVAWRATPAALAGTTQFGPMLVLERLAGERGMRPVLRVEHRPTAAGSIDHVMTAPRATLTLAAELCAAGLEWPGIMAALVCRGMTTPRAPLSTAKVTTRAAPPALLHDAGETAASFVHYYVPQRMQLGHAPALDGPLYTWLVAPVSTRPSTPRQDNARNRGADDAGTA